MRKSAKDTPPNLPGQEWQARPRYQGWFVPSIGYFGFWVDNSPSRKTRGTKDKSDYEFYFNI